MCTRWRYSMTWLTYMYNWVWFCWGNADCTVDWLTDRMADCGRVSLSLSLSVSVYVFVCVFDCVTDSPVKALVTQLSRYIITRVYYSSFNIVRHSAALAIMLRIWHVGTNVWDVAHPPRHRAILSQSPLQHIILVSFMRSVRQSRDVNTARGGTRLATILLVVT